MNSAGPRACELLLEGGDWEELAGTKGVVGMENLVGDHVFGRDVAALHQVAAKPFEYLQLLGCGAAGFEVAD